ncbi:MAG: 3-deoxy-8-phosphooctulonate synthase [Phycisphaeraceae bacterium]|nr:3-deoxy-8-phosphooctulonate synthase [Phycisphaeraceae bacterium]MCW5767339.1 3-deoxy-8-phosphooctulonate synthase [Phycisphaeraceae bacterium]
MQRVCTVRDVRIGRGESLAIIAGPCVLESLEMGMAIAELLANACEEVGLPYIFKASFDKANRSSVNSPRGPGLSKGLEWLAKIAADADVPVTTDIHLPEHAEPAAMAVDLIQIPAFLCRQTDLIAAAGEAAARHGRGVNVKKGQFLSPAEMRGPVKKLAESGCDNVMLTDRGTFFGYHRLVNDFIGLGDMMRLDTPGGSPPVCFDCTHSTQLPGLGEQSGGRREHSPMLARAAVAAGVDALFIECHPEPSRSLSDAATVLSLSEIPELLAGVARIRDALTVGE